MSDDIDDDDGATGKSGSAPGRLRFPGSHEVGYGRPPEATRFRPGQSGNPAGRPRGAKTRRFPAGFTGLRDAVVSESSRKLPVRESGQDVEIPVIHIVLHCDAASAPRRV